MGARYTVLVSRPCGLAGWLALLLTKMGDVETNPGQTTSNKRVCICDICYKQIHVRKQISIMCNRYPPRTIHRYLDLPSTQRIQTHNSHRHNTTPLDPGPNPLPTLHLHHPHHRNQNIDTRPTLPLFPQDGKSQTQSSHPPTPLSNHPAPSKTHTHLTHSTNSTQLRTNKSPSPNHIYTKSMPNPHYAPSVAYTHTTHIISSTAPT